MDRLEAMALFVNVVDHGGFSAAGRALNMPVSTLSRKIGELEQHLCAQLLIRTTRRLSLTDTGATFLGAARRIIAEVDQAQREATGEFEAPRGALVVTAPVHFGRLHVVPLVADFLALQPQITVQLLLTDQNLDLVDTQVDMAVRIGELDASSLIATRVGTMRTVTCVSPDLLADHEPRFLAELAGMPIVAAGNGGARATWRLREAGRPIDLPVTPRLTVTTTDAAVAAAIRGVGAVQLLHYQVADALSAGALRLMLEPFEPPTLPIHLIHAERQRMPLKLRSFLDHVAPRLRAAFAS